MKLSKQLLLLLFIPGIWGFVSCGKSDSVSPSNTVTGGTGGSMARFTLSGDRLFTLSGNNLFTFDLSDINALNVQSSQLIGEGVETIFAYNGCVFIGSTNGMYIYNQAVPQPTRMSVYTHILSCDPVIADSTFAYVTLRTGNRCNRGMNQLEVIDIKDLKQPKLIREYPMKKPFGLGKSGNLIYLCDELALKIFDASNPTVLTEKYVHPMSNPYDVIPLPNHVVVSAADGISQLMYTGSGIRQLSHIPVMPR